MDFLLHIISDDSCLDLSNLVVYTGLKSKFTYSALVCDVDDTCLYLLVLIDMSG